jgi:hypothetical protein
MVDPPSSLRLLLDHLLKGQVREKKQFLMLQMNKKLPGNQLPKPFSVFNFSKENFLPPPISVSE